MANSLTTSQINAQPLLRVRQLSKNYIAGGRWRRRVPIAAVSDVEFEIQPGQTLAGGRLRIRKVDHSPVRNTPRAAGLRRDLVRGPRYRTTQQSGTAPHSNGYQMIFRDAVTSLNPKFSAEAVEEPLRIRAGAAPGAERSLRPS